jgi:heat-inducible transcriptional repressor
MLDARKTAILRKVVTEHIDTGQPVGSAHVVRDPSIEVSPATVRADMSALEREGYLTHPHTSAGRIPTDLGYRYFVDHLERGAVLDPAREEQVSAFFGRTHGELERLLRDTSQLLSDLTEHTALVVGPSPEILVVRAASLIRLAPRVALLVLVLSNGGVDKHVVEVAEDTSDADIAAASGTLAHQLDGVTFGALPEQRATGALEVDAIVDASYRVLRAPAPSSGDGGVYVGGTARMAEQFLAVDTVRSLLSMLEQSFVVVTLLSDVLALGQSVAIGAENRVASLAECSLVVAPYEVDDEVVGTIGVLGPTRMNYPQALAAVAVVSQHLGHELSKG